MKGFRTLLCQTLSNLHPHRSLMILSYVLTKKCARRPDVPFEGLSSISVNTNRCNKLPYCYRSATFLFSTGGSITNTLQSALLDFSKMLQQQLNPSLNYAFVMYQCAESPPPCRLLALFNFVDCTVNKLLHCKACLVQTNSRCRTRYTSNKLTRFL